MKLRNTLLFWMGFALLFCIFLYLFSSILLPFVAGMALAYLLDPLADRLEALGLSRVLATLFILAVFVVTAVVLLILMLPVLSDQLYGLITHLPDIFNRLQKFVTAQAGSKLFKVLHVSPADVKSSLGDMVSSGASWASSLLTSLLSGGQALMGLASLLLVTPVVAFYMLLDWDHMIRKIDSWLPLDHQETIRALAREMDDGVSNFVRGQVTVSTLLGLFYAISLSIAGLRFGLLVGLFAGLISFIPYVGSMGGGLLAIGIAVMQFWPDYTSITIIIAIFAVGQFIEGNILQPKFIGSHVGLHPVWLMFALFAFGNLFGFVGMLVAVPAAAAMAVLVRFGIGKYLASSFYRGHPPGDPVLEVDYERRDEVS
ncbi:AI-2E family transporter [Oryzibacter oryziterrae]|uniref:AI-2E family transporter n=1 Tax=Oryzibacter oryziterrae TaxID=2766474 RepID=UPI001F42A2F5|nr:AI-2E family transporter [Oryzibacter oryziterrae]